MSKRNVLNLKEVETFISSIAKENPAYEKYIKTVVKNYLVRKGPATRDWMFRFKRDKNWTEQQILDNGGPFYKIDINESTRVSIVKVLDYLRGNNFSPATSIDFEDALKQHEQWIVDLNKVKKEPKAEPGAAPVVSEEKKVMSFSDGFYVVKLINKKAFESEGRNMNHCVGSYDPKTRDIYSLRNSKGESLVTMEVKKDIIEQALAQRNLPIPAELIPKINEFAEKQKWKFRKVTYSASNTAFSSMITPAIVTFLAFKWKEVLSWFMISPGSSSSNSQFAEMLNSSFFMNGMTLGFGLYAAIKWIDYFTNFGGGSSESKIVDKL